MQDAQNTNLFLRHDTILGVCEAIGRDFGFHPNFLRVALCFGLFLSPVGAIAGYLAAGVVVLASRLLFPAPKAVAAAPAAPVLANDDGEDMPIAA